MERTTQHPSRSLRNRSVRAGIAGLVAASAVAAGVGFVVAGDDSDDATVATATEVVAPSAANGSDRHLINLAEDIADRTPSSVGSDRHLVNLADDIADGTAGSDPVVQRDGQQPVHIEELLPAR